MTEIVRAPEYGKLRFGEPGDHPAIMSTWLKSYWNDEPPRLSGLGRATYFVGHGKAMNDLLARESTIAFVVADPENERHLFAWLCASIEKHSLTLHYVYTYKFGEAKFPRGAGFARLLVDRILAERGDRDLVHTHETKAGRKIAKAIGSEFNPYAFEDES